tara:strand:+ start:586 stop:891 length:306 start_codon:yes stop_codon:yes gene_type:complete
MSYVNLIRAAEACYRVFAARAHCLQRVKLAVAGKVSKPSRWCQYGSPVVAAQENRVDCWFVTLLLKTGCGFPQNIAPLGAHFAISISNKYKRRFDNQPDNF